MKDKEKQIEEMREHICIGCSGKPCGEYCDKCKFVAEELLKHYQLKLSKDSVVLTKSELEQVKEQAVKEFATILKVKTVLTPGGWCVNIEDIDKTLKEVIGEKE